MNTNFIMFPIIEINNYAHPALKHGSLILIHPLFLTLGPAEVQLLGEFVIFSGGEEGRKP